MHIDIASDLIVVLWLVGPSFLHIAQAPAAILVDGYQYSSAAIALVTVQADASVTGNHFGRGARLCCRTRFCELHTFFTKVRFHYLCCPSHQWELGFSFHYSSIAASVSWYHWSTLIDFSVLWSSSSVSV